MGPGATEATTTAVGAAHRLPCAARLRVARRNSLRSLRELRSDNRRENDGRSALRAPTPRLRCSAPPTSPPPRRAPLRAARPPGRSAGARTVETGNGGGARSITGCRRLVRRARERDRGPLVGSAWEAGRVCGAGRATATRLGLRRRWRGSEAETGRAQRESAPV